jgi:hypothetical protein
MATVPKKEMYQLEEESVLFLRKSKSGKGIIAFEPTPSRDVPSKYMLIGNVETLKDMIRGKVPSVALTVVKLEPRDEAPATGDDLDENF